MAPKAKTKVSKSDQSKKTKNAEDLTFGLKNKNKSKKVQQYVNNVQQQVKGENVKGGTEAAFAKSQADKNAKKAAAKQAALLASLTKGKDNTKTKVVDVPEGPTVEEMKMEQKIDLYVDPRGPAEVDMVCRDFLKACEDEKYGWFWECPSAMPGKPCAYRHALDEGYILKKDRPKPEDEDYETSVTEKVQAELDKLDKSGGTPVTEESFKVWKEKVQKEREIELKALLEEEAKKKKSRSDKKADGEKVEQSAISGKDLFSINPELFIDDAKAQKVDDYNEDEAYLDEMRAEEEQLMAEHAELKRKMLEEAEEAFDEGAFAEEDLEDLDDLELDDLE